MEIFTYLKDIQDDIEKGNEFLINGMFAQKEEIYALRKQTHNGCFVNFIPNFLDILYI